MFDGKELTAMRPAEVRCEFGTGMAMIFITHDLGVIAEVADEVAVNRTDQHYFYASAQTLSSSRRNDSQVLIRRVAEG